MSLRRVTKALAEVAARIPMPRSAIETWDGTEVKTAEELAEIACIPLWEAKARVRTLAGVRRFGQPLGSEIRLDMTPRTERAAMGSASARLTDAPIVEDEHHVERRGHDSPVRLAFDRDPGWKPAVRHAIEEALKRYRMWTFRPLNEYLREDGEQRIVRRHGTYDMNLETVYIDEALSAAPLRTPIITWRGGSIPQFKDVDEDDLPADLTGVEWEDPGFVSTSPRMEVAANFRSQEGYLLRLHVPAGTGAIQLQSWPDPKRHWLRKNDEAELLLERNLRFRVVSDRIEQHGTYTSYPMDPVTKEVTAVENPILRRVLDVEVMRSPEHEDETKARKPRASELPQDCMYCKKGATKRIIHSEGMAYIPVCDGHLEKGKHDAERCTPDGTVDPTNIDAIREYKALRRVRTPEGARKYGQPIGSIIVADMDDDPGWVFEHMDETDAYLASVFGEPAIRTSGEMYEGPKRKWPVKVGRHRRLQKPAEGERETQYPPMWIIDDYGSIDDDLMLPEQAVDLELVEHVYRAMTLDEWNEAQARGYIQSDGRGVIADWEGTNAGLDAATARSYISYNGEPSVIVKIAVDSGDGWFAIHNDDYLRTRRRIPIERVMAVTAPMRYAPDPESRTGRMTFQRYIGTIEDESESPDPFPPIYRDIMAEVPPEELERARRTFRGLPYNRYSHAVERRDLSDEIRSAYADRDSELDDVLLWAMDFRQKYPGVAERLGIEKAIDSEHFPAYAGRQMQYRRGLTEEVIKEEITDRMREQISGATVIIRRNRESTLQDILRTGRMKTQFETGSSRGAYSPESRSAYEAAAFGYPLDLPPEERPVYGYLLPDGPDSGFDVEKGAPVSHYGGIRIVLKPEVRERTTFLVGDSLWMQGGLPSPMLNPDWRSFDYQWGPDGTYSEVDYGEARQQRAVGYIETQIHGGVRVEDIQEVIFGPEPYIGNPEDETIALLEKHGIPWRVIDQYDPGYDGMKQKMTPSRYRGVRPGYLSRKPVTGGPEERRYRLYGEYYIPWEETTSERRAYEGTIEGVLEEMKLKPGETDEEFEDRKREVALTMMSYKPDIAVPKKADDSYIEVKGVRIVRKPNYWRDPSTGAFLLPGAVIPPGATRVQAPEVPKVPDVPRVPRPRAPRGRRRTRSMYALYPGYVQGKSLLDKFKSTTARKDLQAKYKRTRTEAGTFILGSQDYVLRDFAEKQDWLRPAEQGTPAELDEMIEAGGVELWRGVGGITGPRKIWHPAYWGDEDRMIEDPDWYKHSTVKQWVDLRTGDPHYGTGLYGQGIYTSVSRTVAEHYAGSVSDTWDEATGRYPWVIHPEGLRRMVLRPGARVITWDEIMREHPSILDEVRKGLGGDPAATDKYGRARAKPAVIPMDVGYIAAVMGYDAVLVQGKHDMDSNPEYADQYIILNRGAVLFEEGQIYEDRRPLAEREETR